MPNRDGSLEMRPTMGANLWQIDKYGAILVELLLFIKNTDKITTWVSCPTLLFNEVLESIQVNEYKTIYEKNNFIVYHRISFSVL